MTEEQHALYLSTAQLEDWCVLLLNQCLSLLESQVAASAKGYSVEQSIQQRVIVLWFYFFQQLSPALAATVRKALLRWVQTHLVLDAAKAVAWIVHASAIPYPAETIGMFLPYLCDTILQVRLPVMVVIGVMIFIIIASSVAMPRQSLSRLTLANLSLVAGEPARAALGRRSCQRRPRCP